MKALLPPRQLSPLSGFPCPQDSSPTFVDVDLQCSSINHRNVNLQCSNINLRDVNLHCFNSNLRYAACLLVGLRRMFDFFRLREEKLPQSTEGVLGSAPPMSAPCHIMRRIARCVSYCSLASIFIPSSSAGVTLELRYCLTGAPWAAGSDGIV